MTDLIKLRDQIFSRRWALVVCLPVLALLFLWPLVLHPNAIPMPLTYQTTDLVLTHLSNAMYVHETLRQFGQLPLWNSQLFSGQPFAADPLSGYWYLPNWLVVAFPVPAAFNALFWLHLTWAGLGMYAFLRSNGLRKPAALFAGAAFMGTPKLIAYIAGGQVSLVFAVTWMPWLMLSVLRLERRPNRQNLLLFAACLAIITLADVRWGFYAALLAGAFILTLLLSNAGRAFHHRDADRRKVPLRTTLSLLWINRLGVSAVLVVLLTAGLTLPLLEFMGLSRRSSLTLDALSIFPIAPASLIGLLAPQLGLVYELVIYIGLGVLLLALFGVQRSPFWGAVALFAGLFSMGQHAFIFPLAVRLLPGLSWLRVPSRVWFIVAFALAILAGYGLDQLLAGGFSPRSLRRMRLIGLGASAMAIFLSAGMMLISHSILPSFLLFGLMTPLVWAVVLGLLSGRLSGSVGSALILLLLLVDLSVTNSSYLTYARLPARSPAVTWLEGQPGLYRVYSPSYSLPMPNLLQQANGVDPLHLDDYARLMQAASGISGGEYSVSLPDIYVDANTPQAMREASTRPDLELLGKLNVRYLAATYPLKTGEAGLKLAQRFGDTYVYENSLVSERAWLEGGQAKIASWSPGNLTIETSGPAGLLTVSEMAYPGWRLRVDGQPRPVLMTGEGLMAVQLGFGSYRVELAFRPLSIYLGWSIALVSWLVVAALLLKGLWRGKRS